jgi:hypothetical protein
MVGVDFDASVRLLMDTEESISLGVNNLKIGIPQVDKVPQRPPHLAAPVDHVCTQFFIREQGVMTFFPNVSATYKHELMAFAKVSNPGVIPSFATSLLRVLEPPDLLNQYGCQLESRDQNGIPGGLWLVDQTWGPCDGKVQWNVVQRRGRSLWYTVSYVEKGVLDLFLC